MTKQDWLYVNNGGILTRLWIRIVHDPASADDRVLLKVKEKTRVTLREIAEQAGVTRMAVSLALRGRSGVSGETRKAVLDIARKMGYEPDPELAKLLLHIRKRTPSEVKSCLGLLTSGPTMDAWKNSMTESKYVEGARERAKEYGYRLEEFWMNEPGMSGDRLSSIIWNRGIEGVIIAPLQERLSGNSSRKVDFDFNLFAAVEISETVKWPDMDRSIHDQYTAMQKVLGALLKMKYRKPGLVLEESLDLRTNGKWTAAYLQYPYRSTYSHLPPPLIMANPSQSLFDRWFDRHAPDVIISVDGLGHRFLKSRGVAVPRQVGYASLDLAGNNEERVNISGIDQVPELVGAAAVDMLVVTIQRGQRGNPAHPVRTEVEGRWIAGKTTVRQRRSDLCDPRR